MRTAVSGSTVPHVDEFIDLAADRGGLRVSMFLPTRRTGPSTLPARVRFWNLVRRAEHVLRTDGLSTTDISAVMCGAWELVEDMWLWERPANGIALFASAGTTRTYWVPTTLPEMATVGDRFVITPLLPTLNAGDRFLVLQLGQAETRLFAGTRSGFDELTSLGSLDVRTPLAHQHFELIEAVVRDAAGQTNAPLVVVGEPHLQATYRRMSSWPDLMTPTITDVEDRTSPETMHRRTWPIVEPVLRARDFATADAVQALRGTGRTLHDSARIVTAAEHGQVQTLIVATESTWRGQHPDEPVAIRLREEPTLHEQLGTAAVAVLHHAGSVFTVPAHRMPKDTTTAALLRK